MSKASVNTVGINRAGFGHPPEAWLCLVCGAPKSDSRGSRCEEALSYGNLSEEIKLMWGLEELSCHREIIDDIDWEMTPEKAVETYLEWGTGWSRKGDFVRYPGQHSLYFVIYDWEDPPQVTLVRRTMREADEIAKIQTPGALIRKAIDEGGRKPGVGVYAITDELKQWLQRLLGC